MSLSSNENARGRRSKEVGAELILSAAMHQRVQGVVETTLLGEVSIKGQTAPMAFYTVVPRLR